MSTTWIVFILLMLLNCLFGNPVLNWIGYGVGLTIGRVMLGSQRIVVRWADAAVHGDGTTEQRKHRAPASCSPMTSLPPASVPPLTGGPVTHIDHRLIPTDLKQPAMDAGYPPDRPTYCRACPGPGSVRCCGVYRADPPTMVTLPPNATREQVQAIQRQLRTRDVALKAFTAAAPTRDVEAAKAALRKLGITLYESEALDAYIQRQFDNVNRRESFTLPVMVNDQAEPIRYLGQ